MTQDIAAAVIQRQLEAYNAKDLDALLDTYVTDAERYSLHGALLARGRDTLRARFAERFLEPDLHARLVSRTVMGNFVTDLEVVTRNVPEGRAPSRCSASMRLSKDESSAPPLQRAASS